MDLGWIQDRFRMDSGWIQDGFRMDLGWIPAQVQRRSGAYLVPDSSCRNEEQVAEMKSKLPK